MPPSQATPVETYLRELHRRLAPLADGQVASYIPELARADPSSFGISLATQDGHVYEVGDSDRPFTIQSVSKPFAFGMALDDRGVDEVLRRVGVEPTGDAFNSIVLDEIARRPFNPMVNAGAIVTSGLVAGAHRGAQLERILHGLAAFAGHELGVDEAVFASERETGHRNRAIAHLMRGFDMLDDDVDNALELYFRQCSVEVTCRDLAVMAATLANRGVNPLTGVRALEERHVAKVLSVMSSCGMYDYAGEWVYRIGMPAKSGVSGGLLAVLPGQFGIAVYSPLLDQRGNSMRGIAVCAELSKAFGLHLLTPHSSVPSTIRRHYRGDGVRSKKARRPVETEFLDREGAGVRVYELQGDLFFASVESLTRTTVADLVGAVFVILDCKRIGRVDRAGAGLFADLCRMITTAGPSVLVANLKEGSGAHTALVALIGVDSEVGDVRLVGEIDSALQWCEDQLLQRGGLAPGDVPPLGLAGQELLAGLDAAEVAVVEAATHLERFEQGGTIFEEGDEASALYFLAAGSVELMLRIGAEERQLRLATVGPGVAFGEMAALDGALRSATARADEPALCHVLDVKALASLCRSHPGLAITLHRNVARRVSGLLRLANDEIRSLQE
ncbi:MAG: glutaminase A [Acidimicrobiales bacterium]